MAKIAFLLMAHKDPEQVIAQTRALTAHGDSVTIHFDQRAGRAPYGRLVEALGDHDRVAFAPRTACGWGTWSLVHASLRLIRTARKRFPDASHYFLISGDCYPTKSRSFIDRYLDGFPDRDTIEVQDFYESGWIRTGLSKERLIYRHVFNEREQKWLFYKALDLQRRFGWVRETPDDLKMRIGSQWWLLRRSTIDLILAKLKERPAIARYFSTTWIPDEIFFQTMVASVVPDDEILSQPPTHLIFSDYGMPVVFYRDHFDYLRTQPNLFARKLSEDADEMRREFLDIFAEDRQSPQEGGTEPGLYGYLTGRGRRGERYASRFWQRAISPVDEGELLIVTAKLWHIGKAVEDTISRVVGIPKLGYLFDEDEMLPVKLGGLERGLAKRGRHRRATINLILDALDQDRAILCIDPGRIDIINDLVSARGHVRVLAIERPITDWHLDDHGRRMGLLGPHSGTFEQDELRRALRYEFDTEVATLRRSHKSRVFTNALERSREENILDIGHFLQCRRAEAEAIARETERLTG